MQEFFLFWIYAKCVIWRFISLWIPSPSPLLLLAVCPVDKWTQCMKYEYAFNTQTAKNSNQHTLQIEWTEEERWRIRSSWGLPGMQKRFKCNGVWSKLITSRLYNQINTKNYWKGTQNLKTVDSHSPWRRMVKHIKLKILPPNFSFFLPLPSVFVVVLFVIISP